MHGSYSILRLSIRILEAHLGGIRENLDKGLKITEQLNTKDLTETMNLMSIKSVLRSYGFLSSADYYWAIAIFIAEIVVVLIITN